MRICALASGSSGNCFYLEGKKNALIIDSGISWKQFCMRTMLRGIDFKKIRGIFISHEHDDHISNAEIFSEKLNVPIFMSESASKNCSFGCNILEKDDLINFFDFKITCFLKKHDCKEPLSFLIEENNKKVGIITDIGKVCKNVSNAISQSDFLIFESNHDIEMLKSGPYPVFLKERILGEKGHLSNFHSGISLLEFSEPKLKGVILAHLSKTNNTPEIALKTVSELIRERRDLKPKIFVSTREEPTKVFEI